MPPIDSDQFRQAIQGWHGEPVPIAYEGNRPSFYLISATQFEAVDGLIEKGQFEPREAYPLIARTAGDAGWSDPIMDDYNDLNADRSQS